ncbi:shikimate dehydrogenase [Polynucleobacter sp. AM-26B4]|uniref:shikimate dehydrogenase n=1 Tax=Polynucleobacter sp. AM-26B4 TaxID=2689103 RepID=UPI002103A6EF|nr:shikimate dehydrogenase [Polynucleobacter sp. AM-26B4]
MNTMSQAMTDQVNPKDYPGKDAYAVIGNPIAHSKSPLIHEVFAKQTQQAIHYGRIFSELDDFKKTTQEFFERGGKGLNVTIPFKLQAYELAQHKTPRAQSAQAANMLWVENGQLWCDNSDGEGLTRDLRRLLKQRSGAALNGINVLILGAGGAAQGVIEPLMGAGVASITVFNRTHEKAEALVKQFTGVATEAKVHLKAQPLAELKNGSYDLIINATATGLSNESPIAKDVLQAIIHPDTLAYDMVYGKETCFMQDAKALGIQAVDGLGMLVEQAALAFETWRQLDLEKTPLDINGAIAAVRASY